MFCKTAGQPFPIATKPFKIGGGRLWLAWLLGQAGWLGRLGPCPTPTWLPYLSLHYVTTRSIIPMVGPISRLRRWSVLGWPDWRG